MCSVPDVVIEDWFVPKKNSFRRKSENFFASHVTVGVLWVGVGCPLWTQPLLAIEQKSFVISTLSQSISV